MYAILFYPVQLSKSSFYIQLVRWREAAIVLFKEIPPVQIVEINLI